METTARAAASYTAAGQDWQALFEKEDTDHSGELDLSELRSLFRKVLKLTPRELSNQDVTRLFKKLDKVKGHLTTTHHHHHHLTHLLQYVKFYIFE